MPKLTDEFFPFATPLWMCCCSILMLHFLHFCSAADHEVLRAEIQFLTVDEGRSRSSRHPPVMPSTAPDGAMHVAEVSHWVEFHCEGRPTSDIIATRGNVGQFRVFGEPAGYGYRYTHVQYGNKWFKIDDIFNGQCRLLLAIYKHLASGWQAGFISADVRQLSAARAAVIDNDYGGREYLKTAVLDVKFLADLNVKQKYSEEPGCSIKIEINGQDKQEYQQECKKQWDMEIENVAQRELALADVSTDWQGRIIAFRQVSHLGMRQQMRTAVEEWLSDYFKQRYVPAEAIGKYVQATFQLYDAMARTNGLHYAPSPANLALLSGNPDKPFTESNMVWMKAQTDPVADARRAKEGVQFVKMDAVREYAQPNEFEYEKPKKKGGISKWLFG